MKWLNIYRVAVTSRNRSTTYFVAAASLSQARVIARKALSYYRYPKSTVIRTIDLKNEILLS